MITVVITVTRMIIFLLRLDNKETFPAVLKEGGAVRGLSQPPNYSYTECRPLLKFVKAMEPPDHGTLTAQPPVVP